FFYFDSQVFHKLVNLHCTAVTLAVFSHCHHPFIHLLLSYYKHVRHLHQLRIPDLLTNFLTAVINFYTNISIFQFLRNRLCISHKLIADGKQLHLHGRQPCRESAGIVLEQESDETLMCAQGRSVNDEGSIGLVVLGNKFKVESSALCKVNLVGCKRELSADRAPNLHVDLGTIECSFILNLHERRVG